MLKNYDILKKIFEIEYLEDPVLGGYIAYFKYFPEVIVEGDSKKDAEIFLTQALYLIYENLN